MHSFQYNFLQQRHLFNLFKMLRNIEKSWCRTIELGFFYLPPHEINLDVKTSSLPINSKLQTAFRLINVLNMIIGFLCTCLLFKFLISNKPNRIFNFAQISIFALIVFVTFSSSLILYLKRKHTSAIHGVNQLIDLRTKIYRCKTTIHINY